MATGGGNITYTIEFAAQIARLVDNSAEGARTVKKMSDDIESAVGVAKNALGALGVALSAEQFKSMIEGANEAVAAFGRLGEVAGTTGVVMSSFEEPARLARTSLDSVAASVARLGKSIGEARTGDVEKAGLLTALGIDPSQGEDAAQAMTKLAASLSGMNDQAVAGYIASQLLGKSFAELRPFMKELTEAGELHATVTLEQIARAKELDDQLAKLGLQSDQTKRQLAEGLSPALLSITEALILAKAQGGGLVTVGEALGTALRAVTSVVMGAVEAFVLAGKSLAIYAAAQDRILHGDLRGAIAAVVAGMEDMSESAQAAGQRIEKVWDDTATAAKKAMTPDGADDKAIAAAIAEAHARELMEFKKHYEERVTLAKGFATLYADAIRTQNALAAEAMRAGDISQKDYIKITAQNEDARLQVLVQALDHEIELHKKKGDLAKIQAAETQKAAAQAARVANEALAHAKISSLEAVSDTQWKQALAKDIARIQQKNFTEIQLLEDKYTEEQNIIDEAGRQGFITDDQWMVLSAQNFAAIEKQKTAIHDDETKKRFGIANVYRQLDAQSATYFLGVVSEMMTSKNREMWEIGKAAAISKTIIDTITAAQGSYAALAGIPYVGPFLGAAAAAAAIVAGIARVEQIKNTQFGSSSSASSGVATPVFAASPATGLPVQPIAQDVTAPRNTVAAAAMLPTQDVHITFVGGTNKDYTYDEVATEIIPLINQAVGNGVNITVSSS